MKKSSSFLVTLLCFVGLMFSPGIFAQIVFPTSCTSKDLTLLTATLPAPAGDRCNCNGDRVLILGIHNGTNSLRTSFALWGTLIRKNGAGTTIDSLPIFACASGVKGKTQIPNGDNFLTASTIEINGIAVSTNNLGQPVIHINCGESLDIVDMHLAWTTSNDNETCDVLKNSPSTINPKCGTQALIHVGIGIEGAIVKTNATCTTNGSLQVSPSGGISPYQVCLYKKTGASDSVLIDVCTSLAAGASTTFTGLVAADYTIRITDNMNESDVSKRCFLNKFSTVTQPDQVAAPAATVDQPTCTSATGTVHITSPAAGVTYTLVDKSNASNNYTADGSGNFIGVTANKTYALSGSKGSCSTNGNDVVVNAQPQTPAVPAATVVQPTCTTATGTVNVTNPDATITYTLKGPSPSTATHTFASGGFAGLAAGSYDLTATKNGCTSAAITKVVNTQPQTPSFTVCITQPTLCSTGSLHVNTPTGGSDFTYQRNALTPQNSQDFTGLGAASVTSITVTNSDGCSTTMSCSSLQNVCPGTLRAPTTNGLMEETQSTTVKAYPNPFNDKVRFVVSSPEDGNGTLELYNMMGQKIKVIYSGHFNAGTQNFEMSLPVKQFATLVYVLRVGGKQITGKLIQAN